MITGAGCVSRERSVLFLLQQGGTSPAVPYPGDINHSVQFYPSPADVQGNVLLEWEAGSWGRGHRTSPQGFTEAGLHNPSWASLVPAVQVGWAAGPFLELI